MVSLLIIVFKFNLRNFDFVTTTCYIFPSFSARLTSLTKWARKQTIDGLGDLRPYRQMAPLNTPLALTCTL